jgi:gliding motility-associated lipoprotein GldD
MRKKTRILIQFSGTAFVLASILLLLPACKKNYTPKPKSYFRIDFPDKKYFTYTSPECAYSFEVPEYASIIPFKGQTTEPCWIDVEFPGYKGVIHITYKRMNDDELAAHAGDIRTLAYKHIIKADDIIEKPFSFPDRHVHGMLYDIRGNTASSLSFFVTDSASNFLSGSLYFNVVPNKDSLAPVIRFFSADVMHLIETIKWN